MSRSLLARAPRPDAIFCTTDEIAFGVARRCFEMGIDPARDITLFGFDGNPLNAFLAPWLSTVQVPYEGFGSSVGTVLDRIWAGETMTGRDAVILPHRMMIAPRGQDG
jgi:LacI family transcriptional regulator